MEYGGALLIGNILIMIAVLTLIFPEIADDKPGHKNWNLIEIWKQK
jgi:hypothetical protein